MKRRRILLWIAAAAAAVALVGGSWHLACRTIPVPEVAILHIDLELDEPYTNLIGQTLEDLRADPAVRAAVLDVSTPGGGVTASESLYYDILALREQVPVVVSMGEVAASGGYYISAAADQIYAKPTSLVGNIGVLSYLPDPDLVDELLITTGPFKLTGGTATEWVRQMETLKNTFLAAVLAQREQRLTVPVETLARGELYIGIDAKQIGLVDELGSRADAVEAAAELAGITRYTVVDRTPEMPETDLVSTLLGEASLGPATTGAAAGSSAVERLAPGMYYLYLQPGQ
ncbi:MAG TPA: S49 family peptidase [Anaerolineae bacterium]|nr:S49 family peptidase [Anaerolineae bacterium]